MKFQILTKLLLPVFLLASACGTRKLPLIKDDGKINVVFIQINDVYEIAPLANGSIGGMARVGQLKKELKQTNPNTYMLMAGDFLSPSVYNSLKYEGKSIRGRQMVEAMNIAGVDLAVFGNHEFDIKEDELQDRINESTFKWVSSNTFQVKNSTVQPFEKRTSITSEKFPESYILSVRDTDGTTAKIGFIGITLPFNKASFVSYTDPLITAKKVYNQIKDSVDAVVALTHQLMEDDVELARQIPGLQVIAGGHEHDMRFQKEGNVYITKAHANAKSAYVINMSIDKNTKLVTVNPVLKNLDQSVLIDSTVNKVVDKWIEIADGSFGAQGFDSKAIVLANSEPLDGRETEIRTQSTNLTRLVTSSMLYAYPEADGSIFNSGSIRVDDVLQAPVTQYDIIRTLPFGGGVHLTEMKGNLLQQILDTGLKNRGIGGFLQYGNINYETNNTWTVKGLPIDPQNNYKIVITDFLLTGNEANLEFLTENNPGMIKVYPEENNPKNLKSDIRLLIIDYLKNK
ncbi:bifunctional metallophosphatase/5'-nucleotidase [Daejeonella oryzae]|uniref:bifunctional metallophosphatase/5'-nucleotidase n=1 Tax=Daejeonella oryzae TaxID=1122943 RepID=UPI00040A6375|nr:bifunctional metallophosphatase/5'-nucleotidase [Daejeonella oryzae]